MKYKKIYDPKKGFVCDYVEKKVNEIRFALYENTGNRKDIEPQVDKFKKLVYKLVDPREYKNLDIIIKDLYQSYNQIKQYISAKNNTKIESIIKELVTIFSEPADPNKSRKLGRNIDELLVENKVYIKRAKNFGRKAFAYEKKFKDLVNEIDKKNKKLKFIIKNNLNRDLLSKFTHEIDQLLEKFKQNTKVKYPIELQKQDTKNNKAPLKS